jgi:hypothetical protein
MVHRVWRDIRFLDEVNPQRRLVWKLQVLKQSSKLWFMELKLAQSTRLVELESKIKELIYTAAHSSLSEADSALYPLLN